MAQRLVIIAPNIMDCFGRPIRKAAGALFTYDILKSDEAVPFPSRPFSRLVFKSGFIVKETISLKERTSVYGLDFWPGRLIDVCLIL